MLVASVVFFATGLLCMALAWLGMAGLSFELGRILMSICLTLAVITFILSLAGSSRRRLTSEELTSS
jgi:hypothetical protein